MHEGATWLPAAFERDCSIFMLSWVMVKFRFRALVRVRVRVSESESQ
jgi:hypothetical protein